MAKFANLFGGRKKNAKLEPAKEPPPSPTSKDEPRSFSKDQIRVLLFRECEWRGRKLLLDSQSIKTTGPTQQKCGFGRFYCQLQGQKTLEPSSNGGCRRERKEGYTEVSPNGTIYQYLRPSPDAKMLGEMIFGSAPLTYDGSTIKIHTIRSPPQLMVTKIFPAPTCLRSRCGRDVDDSCSLQNSVSEETSSCNESENILSQSVPVDLGTHFAPCEELEYITRTTPCSLESNESYSSLLNGGMATPEGSSSNLASMVRSGSYNSLQRRLQRNISTSIEFGFGLRRHCDNGIGHVGSSDGSLGIHKRTKLGMSVIITLSDDEDEEKRFQNFFFNHVTLVENHINKLSATIEKAYSNRRQFVTTVMEGLEVLQQSIFDLYTAPRLDEPVWLSMMVPGERRRAISARFVAEFMSTLEQFDTKATNFFVSTLLTAVLTHHLAWVPTVTPAGIPPSQSFHKKHTAKWLDMFAKSHPYNPLWVQLGDLYGSLGFPRKLAKTVIVGKKSHVVRRMINVVGYFVRCSEIYETLESRITPPNETVEGNVLPPLPNEAPKPLLTQTAEKPVPPPRSNRKNRNNICVEQSHKVCGTKDPCNRCGLSECVCRKVRNCHRVASEGSLRTVDGGNEDAMMGLQPAAPDNGKVMFTIGDIPLVEICSEKLRQFRADSPEREAPVCTCGLHVIVNGEVKVGKSARDLVEGSGSLVGELETCSRCDSGFRSCEESMSNVSLADGRAEGKQRAGLAVHALDLGIPTAKVEHLRNVGRSVVGNAVVEQESLVKQMVPKQRIVAMLPRDYNKLRFSHFERSTSMFDEYFDENVELKMLDDANFETKLQTAKENFFGKKKAQEDGCTLRTVGSSATLSDAMRDGSEDTSLLVSRDSLLEKICGCQEAEECLQCFPQVPFEEGPGSPGSTCSDVVAAAVHVPLPKSDAKQVRSSSAEFYCSFGRSLMADITSHYVSDFAVQGTTSKIPREKLYADLAFAVENPVIDEPISEAVCIVADTDLWSVELASSQSATNGTNDESSHLGARVTLSQLIAQMMETLLHLWKIHMSPEFCIMHLEDRLQELYFKSRLLAEHLEDGGPRDVNTVTSALAVDRSDLPLLMAVASTHAPRVTCTYGVSYR